MSVVYHNGNRLSRGFYNELGRLVNNHRPARPLNTDREEPTVTEPDFQHRHREGLSVGLVVEERYLTTEWYPPVLGQFLTQRKTLTVVGEGSSRCCWGSSFRLPEQSTP